MIIPILLVCLTWVSYIPSQKIKIMPLYHYQNIKYPYTIKSVFVKLYTRAHIVKSADFTSNTHNVLGTCTLRNKINFPNMQILKNSLAIPRINDIEYNFKPYIKCNKTFLKKCVYTKQLLEVHADHWPKLVIESVEVRFNNKGGLVSAYIYDSD